MPYILLKDRKLYNEDLSALVSNLAKQSEDDLGGHLNYCISFILKRLIENKTRYVRANTLRGAVENAITEFYRCEVTEYENLKRDENGEI